MLECKERVAYIENEKEQRAIILKFYEGKTCHRGIKETMASLRRVYYWKIIFLLKKIIIANIMSFTSRHNIGYNKIMQIM